MNGSLALPLKRGFHYRIYGGPYRSIPASMVGVKMAAEIPAPCAVDIPTRDFHTPPASLAVAGLIKTVDLILAGKPVYIGCMGGIGRTGLMMALLAKAWGIEDPVSYVRLHYIPHAVETKEQKEYVTSFKIPAEVTRKVRKAQLLSYLRFGKKALTQGDAP